tara:strand:- start:162 stop:410 length:249 start_codon:yes stop_codon:yes gene_type:complete
MYNALLAYGEKLHDLSEEYLLERKTDNLRPVINIMNAIDQSNIPLSGTVKEAHKKIMMSMHKDSPDEFMQNVLFSSCAYTLR